MPKQNNKKEYDREMFWKLYKKLPEELKTAVFSDETADNISAVCNKNDIKDVSKMAELIGNVLIGLLPLDEFPEVLEKKLNLKKEIVKQVNHEVRRFIFFPVKAELAALYEKEVTPPNDSQKTAQPLKETPPSEKKLPTPEEKPTPPEEEKPAKQKGSDTYRELIE